MNNNKEFVMPNGFKITGNINYYTKRKLEVLEPQNVRDEIKNSIKKMLEHYT